MGEVKIIGAPVPNLPWQERPDDGKPWMPVWRYSDNPVIGRNPAEGVARIFNSAVMPYEGEFFGVFRMLSRPSDSGHTPFGDIFVSESLDMEYWGDGQET